MAGDSPTAQTSKAAAHLARVRDNQRRSRARRKEYLVELEEKFRRCEQAGVEASFEMQIAARRVLEENAKLRAFLREKGHTDDELDTFTNRTGGAEDAAVAGSSRYEDPQHMTAVQGLESMLKATTSYDSNTSQGESRSSSELSRIQTTSRQASTEVYVPNQWQTGASTSQQLPQSYQESSPYVEQQQQQFGMPARPQQQGFPPQGPPSYRSNPSSSSDFGNQTSAAFSTYPSHHNFMEAEFPQQRQQQQQQQQLQPHPRTHAQRQQQQQPHRNQHRRQQEQHRQQQQQYTHAEHSTRQPLYSQHSQPWTTTPPNSMTPFTHSNTRTPLQESSAMSSPSSIATAGLGRQSIPNPYISSTTQHTNSAPHTFFAPDGSTVDVTNVADISELLLAPDLQAQFLRGLGAQNPGLHTGPEVYPQQSSHIGLEPGIGLGVLESEQVPWKTEDEPQQQQPRIGHPITGDEYMTEWSAEGESTGTGRNISKSERDWKRW